jgi:hypothetical protein
MPKEIFGSNYRFLERTKLLPQAGFFLALQQRQHLARFIDLYAKRIVLSDPRLVLFDLG